MRVKWIKNKRLILNNMSEKRKRKRKRRNTDADERGREGVVLGEAHLELDVLLVEALQIAPNVAVKVEQPHLPAIQILPTMPQRDVRRRRKWTRSA